MEPEYAQWLRKTVWSRQELFYLIAGLDPACNPQNAGVSVDLDTGESTPVEPDEAELQNVAKAAVEMQRRGIPDLIGRAVKAGDLKSTDVSGEYFRTHEVIAYLIKHNVSMPAQMTGAFNEALLMNALKNWFASPLETLPADVRARINRDFFPMSWDDLTQEQRKSVAAQRDYQHDPSTQEERGRIFDLTARQIEIEQDIRELELMAAHTPLERESKERQLTALRAKLQSTEAEIDRGATLKPTRDEELQASADALAAQWKREGRRVMTKREIAKELSKSDDWKEITANRIERIIRATWG